MSVQLKELREQAARISTNAKAKLDEIRADTPAERQAEIEREFDVMMSDYDKLTERADRHERVIKADERMNARDPRRPNGENVDENQRGDVGDLPEYREVFTKALRRGVDGLSAEEREMLQSHGNVDPEIRAQGTASGAAGGYTVPQEFSGEIDKAMAAWGPMWDANVVRELNTVTGAKLPWPTVDDTAHEGSDVAENAPNTDDGSADVVFGEKQLDAYIRSTGVVRIPMQLLDDSGIDIEALMNDLFAERLGRGANKLLTIGTGSGQPSGILTASGLGKTAVATGAITSDEVLDLFHSVDSVYRQSPKCRFQFNDSTLATLRKLKDGEGNYLWQMGDFRAQEPDTLLGKPYSINAAMPSIAAAAKPILFGDHSRYIVRKVNGFAVMVLRERYAENFQVGMIGFKRFDGELLNNKAVKHLAMKAA